MPFGSHPSTGLSRYPAAIALGLVSLVGTAYFAIKAPTTGLPPTGTVKVIELQNGSGAQVGVCYDNGNCSFNGTVLSGGAPLLTATQGDNLYVNVSGDTMTGSLIVTPNYAGPNDPSARLATSDYGILAEANGATAGGKFIGASGYEFFGGYGTASAYATFPLGIAALGYSDGLSIDASVFGDTDGHAGTAAGYFKMGSSYALLGDADSGSLGRFVGSSSNLNTVNLVNDGSDYGALFFEGSHNKSVYINYGNGSNDSTIQATWQGQGTLFANANGLTDDNGFNTGRAVIAAAVTTTTGTPRAGFFTDYSDNTVAIADGTYALNIAGSSTYNFPGSSFTNLIYTRNDGAFFIEGGDDGAAGINAIVAQSINSVRMGDPRGDGNNTYIDITDGNSNIAISPGLGGGGATTLYGTVKVSAGITQGAGPPGTTLTNYNLYVDNLTGILYVD